ncbi:MAG TPA: helix-turn-helix transcriptional regulator [Blastocatellia bacterium]|nr:helix-turn-helix transcriptional regulator [Blastocatellia bacterium]
MVETQVIADTPLAIFVRGRLAELGMKQSTFCRLTGFDQGSLSKILSSMITNLSLESVLRLSIGLRVSPERILNLLDRMDLHELIMKSYAGHTSDMDMFPQTDLPEPVLEVSRLALRAHMMGRSLTPALGILYPLATMSREQSHRRAAQASGDVIVIHDRQSG